jgi:taurine dioxygenase
MFGELTVHPFSPNSDKTPELIIFDNKEDNPPFGTDIWHSDETFRQCPPLGTCLRALDVPEVGGDTVFASMSAAYEGLSDRMKNFISGLEAIHDFKPFKQLFDDDDEGRKELQRFELMYPPVTHPIVRTHPVTGNKSIFVNPQFTIRIIGMNEIESRSLLTDLFDLAKIPEYQYRHHWYNNTMVLWDNRSVQHYAVHDYWPKRRQMERVTVEGDRPFSSDENVTLDALKSRKSPQPEGTNVNYGGHSPKRQHTRNID